MIEHGQYTDNFRTERLCMTFKKSQMFVLLRIFGGADRDRTDDLLNAIQALSQLSYGPTIGISGAYRQISFVNNSVTSVHIACLMSRYLHSDGFGHTRTRKISRRTSP